MTQKNFRVTVRFDNGQTGYQVIVGAVNPNQAERIAKNTEGADWAKCCCQVN